MSDWQMTDPLGTPQTGPNRFDIMASGLRGRDRNKRPPGEPIRVKNGNQLVESGFYRREQNGRIQYVDQDGNPIEGQQQEAARAFDLAQREGKVFDLESQQAVNMPSGGDAPDRSGERQRAPAEGAARENRTDFVGERREQREQRMSEARASGGVSFHPDGTAFVPTPEGLTIGSGNTAAAPREINYRTARDLSPDQAREIYRKAFGRDLPPDRNPVEALSEELRNAQGNMRRQ
jgi:hypothetical protein